MEIKNKVFFHNGKPFFPVMGEYQYSRTFASSWDEDMKKMKALGINAISTYSFWIHHEEIEGEFDFKGNKDIRLFLETAKRNDLLVCLRIGPWVHAESRNGGFPDWIYSKGCGLRKNDPVYLAYVRRYFEALFHECKGYMEKDEGPVCFIQVENEYSQWGKQGEDFGDVHINKLIAMLKEIGFDVPIYMATGWGEAAIGKAIPVWGAYCEAPWEFTDEELPPADGYLFSENPNDQNIGSDTGKKDFDLASSLSKFPYATVELGGGIQMTHARRPIMGDKDNACLAFCRLGSGVDALGYYVFHGGIQPSGKLTSMQEYRRENNIDAGFACDLPEKDYDFQAPISQYGKVRASAKEFKLVNMFASEFAFDLLGNCAVFPKDNAVSPTDYSSPRYCFRGREESGFLFINNFVRHQKMKPHWLSEYTHNFELPSFKDKEVLSDSFFALPLNLRIGKDLVRFSSASPFMKLNEDVFLFYSEFENPEIIRDTHESKYLILNRMEALNCYKFKIKGKEYALICGEEIYQDGEELHISSNGSFRIKAYPELPSLPSGFNLLEKEGEWFVYECLKQGRAVSCKLKELKPLGGNRVYRIALPDLKKHNNVYLSLSFFGDSLDLYIDGKKENDHFYCGRPFEVGLQNYGFPREIEVRIHPLYSKEKVYVEVPLRYENGVACELTDVSLEVEDEMILDFKDGSSSIA